jgi:hypothetical protein
LWKTINNWREDKALTEVDSDSMDGRGRTKKMRLNKINKSSHLSKPQ